MKICVIGAGYVGLVSGSCFADLGNFVWCVDKDKQKIDMLNNNQIPIFEPGLKDLINKKRVPGYIKTLIKNYPKITSGRKNFAEHHLRIIETIKLIKKYYNTKSK